MLIKVHFCRILVAKTEKTRSMKLIFNSPGLAAPPSGQGVEQHAARPGCKWDEPGEVMDRNYPSGLVAFHIE